MNESFYYVNSLSNKQGVLHLKISFGKYFWQMEDSEESSSGISEHLWTLISKELFDQLVKLPDTVKETKKNSRKKKSLY